MVHVRLVVRAGPSHDGDRPSVSLLTAATLVREAMTDKAVGKSPKLSAATLGAPEIDVRETADAIVFSGLAMKGQLDALVERMAAMVQRPRFAPDALMAARAMQRERALGFARTSSRRVAHRVLFQELFRQPSSYPYAAPVALARDLDKVTLNECRAFHKAHYVPSRVRLVVAGDVDSVALMKSVEGAFGAWTGTPSEARALTDPAQPDVTRVLIADQPSFSDSLVAVASLGPRVQDPSWPALMLGARLLEGEEPPCDGATAGVDPSPQLPLAPLNPIVGEGVVPFVACVASPTTAAADSLSRMMDRLKALAAKDPEPTRLDAVREAFIGRVAGRLGSVDAFADVTAAIASLGLPENSLEKFVAALRAVTVEEVANALRIYVREGHLLVVVVGNASQMDEALAKYGDVFVLDPVQGFQRKRSVAANAGR